jgi:ankyrin repeat protein
MVTNQNIRDEIDEYLVNYEEGFSTQDSLESIESLLSRATPDVKNNTLHYAVKVGEPELVDIIIDNGADVNSVIERQTPMMAAIIDPDSHWENQREIIRTLLDRGANPSEVVDGKSVDDVIESEINNNNREADIRILENIREMIDQRKDRIEGGKRKRKRTQKKKNKNKKRKSSKNKKRKSRRTRKHRK